MRLCSAGFSDCHIQRNAAAYVREGYSNIRVGMFLEMATTAGALVGASLVVYLHASVIAVIFGLVLIYSAFVSFHERSSSRQDRGSDRIATWLRLDSTFRRAPVSRAITFGEYRWPSC